MRANDSWTLVWKKGDWLKSPEDHKWCAETTESIGCIWLRKFLRICPDQRTRSTEENGSKYWRSAHNNQVAHMEQWSTWMTLILVFLGVSSNPCKIWYRFFGNGGKFWITFPWIWCCVMYSRSHWSVRAWNLRLKLRFFEIEKNFCTRNSIFFWDFAWLGV